MVEKKRVKKMAIIKQRTIKAPVSVKGTGLHTGKEVTMTFKPAPANHGYKFKRIDLPDSPVIKAEQTK